MNFQFVSPDSKEKLKLFRDSQGLPFFHYCEEVALVYPIKDEIRTMLPPHARNPVFEMSLLEAIYSGNYLGVCPSNRFFQNS
jgi:uncharacterized protein YbaR (Trm112 family)